MDVEESCPMPALVQKNMALNYVNERGSLENILTYYTDSNKNNFYKELYEFTREIGTYMTDFRERNIETINQLDNDIDIAIEQALAEENLPATFANMLESKRKDMKKSTDVKIKVIADKNFSQEYNEMNYDIIFVLTRTTTGVQIQFIYTYPIYTYPIYTYPSAPSTPQDENLKPAFDSARIQTSSWFEHYKDTYKNDQLTQYSDAYTTYIRPYLLDILANGNFLDSMAVNKPYYCIFNTDMLDYVGMHKDNTFRTIITYIDSPVTTEFILTRDSKKPDYNEIIPPAPDYYNACPLIRFHTYKNPSTTIFFNDDLVRHTIPIFTNTEFGPNHGFSADYTTVSHAHPNEPTTTLFKLSEHRQKLESTDRKVLVFFIFNDMKSLNDFSPKTIHSVKTEPIYVEDIMPVKSGDSGSVVNITKDNIGTIIELVQHEMSLGDVPFIGGKKKYIKRQSQKKSQRRKKSRRKSQQKSKRQQKSRRKQKSQRKRV